MVTFKMDASKAIAELMLSNYFKGEPVLDRQTHLDFSVPGKWSGFSGTWREEKFIGKAKLLKLRFNGTRFL